MDRIKTKLSPEMWSGVDWSLSAGPLESEVELDGDEQIGRSDGFLGIGNLYSGRQGGQPWQGPPLAFMCKDHCRVVSWSFSFVFPM